jgi:hypothetical protein
MNYLLPEYNIVNTANELHNIYLPFNSSETVSFFLPLALLLARTLRPFAVDMRSRNPWVFFLLRCDG